MKYYFIWPDKWGEKTSISRVITYPIDPFIFGHLYRLFHPSKTPIDGGILKQFFQFDFAEIFPQLLGQKTHLACRDMLIDDDCNVAFKGW